VGEKEATSNTVNVRTRDNIVHGEKTIDEVVDRFALLTKERTRESEEKF
jgi:threonyl-tRNA synthetase